MANSVSHRLALSTPVTTGSKPGSAQRPLCGCTKISADLCCRDRPDYVTACQVGRSRFCLACLAVLYSAKQALGSNALLDRRRQGAYRQRGAVEQTVGRMVDSVAEDLELTDSNADQAVKVLQQVLSATCDAETAFLSVLDDRLALATSMDDRIGTLEKEQARLKALAVFREPVDVFRDFVAEEMGRPSWTRLSSELYLKSFKPPKNQLARQKMAKTLITMNLDIHVWDDVTQVAHAAVKELYHGKQIHPIVLKTCISQGVLPNDSQWFDTSTSAMLGWLVTKIS